MQRLNFSGAVRPLYGSLGVKGLNMNVCSDFPQNFRLRHLSVEEDFSEIHSLTHSMERS